MNWNEYMLHDSDITDIEYDNSVLSLYITEVETRKRLVFKAEVEDYDFSFYYCKRYPVFHQPKFRGKEISLQKLRKMLHRGYSLEIVESLASVDSNLIVFQCDLYPAPRGGGVSKEVFIVIGDYKDIAFNVTGDVSLCPK